MTSVVFKKRHVKHMEQARLIKCLLTFHAAFVFILLAISDAKAVSCTAGFRFCDNCDSMVTFNVKKNTPCTQSYWISKGAVFRQKVTKRPRGIYGTVNQTDGAYQPPLNYVGRDYFEVQIDYERSGSRFKTVLKVTANVSE
jgi:hypothetical protein